MRKMTGAEIAHWMTVQGAGEYDEVRVRVFGEAGSTCVGSLEATAATLEKLGVYAISSGRAGKADCDGFGGLALTFTVCDKADPVAADAVTCCDEYTRLAEELSYEGTDALCVAAMLNGLRTAVLGTGDGADMGAVFGVLRDVYGPLIK